MRGRFGGRKAFGGRVSAEAVAASLAGDGWQRKRRVPRGPGRPMLLPDREGAEALPAGHPVTWAALWGREGTPRFPGLTPMGGPEPGFGVALVPVSTEAMR
jgi:hypothetical protein